MARRANVFPRSLEKRGSIHTLRVSERVLQMIQPHRQSRELSPYLPLALSLSLLEIGVHPALFLERQALVLSWTEERSKDSPCSFIVEEGACPSSFYSWRGKEGEGAAVLSRWRKAPPRFFLPAFSLLVRRACQCRPCPLYKKDSDRVSNSLSKRILHM